MSHSVLATGLAPLSACLLAFQTFSISFRIFVRDDLLISNLGLLNPVCLNVFLFLPLS